MASETTIKVYINFNTILKTVIKFYSGIMNLFRLVNQDLTSRTFGVDLRNISSTTSSIAPHIFLEATNSRQGPAVTILNQVLPRDASPKDLP